MEEGNDEIMNDDSSSPQSVINDVITIMEDEAVFSDANSEVEDQVDQGMGHRTLQITDPDQPPLQTSEDYVQEFVVSLLEDLLENIEYFVLDRIG